MSCQTRVFLYLFQVNSVQQSERFSSVMNLSGLLIFCWVCLKLCLLLCAVPLSVGSTAKRLLCWFAFRTTPSSVMFQSVKQARIYMKSPIVSLILFSLFIEPIHHYCVNFNIPGLNNRRLYLTTISMSLVQLLMASYFHALFGIITVSQYILILK